MFASTDLSRLTSSYPAGPSSGDVCNVRKIQDYGTVGQAAEFLGVSPWTLRY